MNIDEINREILECSRYGEDDDLKAYIAVGGKKHASHSLP